MDATDHLDLRTLSFTTPLAVLTAAGLGLSLPVESSCPAFGCGLLGHDILITAPTLLTATDVIPGHVTCDPCRTICGTVEL